MRETRTVQSNALTFRRITPAYAGNTKLIYTLSAVHEDHPRVCGKHLTDSRCERLESGSPPRMRETLSLSDGPRSFWGITPAYAGNTRRHTNRRGLQLGSPPRMRETRTVQSNALTFRRITPAYAGNTKLIYTLSAVHEDHPRVCGKHLTDSRCERLESGSPPRMRETLSLSDGPRSFWGITPAYAGNTRSGQKF